MSTKAKLKAGGKGDNGGKDKNKANDRGKDMPRIWANGPLSKVNEEKKGYTSKAGRRIRGHFRGIPGG